MRGHVWFDKAKFVSRGARGRIGKYISKSPAYWNSFPRYRRIKVSKNTWR